MNNLLDYDKSPSQTTVCVAMSGGVDSSATAVLLKQSGYKVIGLTMDLLPSAYCLQNASIKDAEKVAEQIGIEHHYINYQELFTNKVIKYFTQSYLDGETPSPCIMCNRHIKLGALADKAREYGADIIVTGHYAEIKKGINGIELHQGKDKIKDQSYFLFDIEKHNLEILRCPLAQYTKDQTRQILKDAGIEIYKKTESQDICFVSEGKYTELIQKVHPEFNNVPGNIVSTSGKILGTHKGLINYTVGQRRGLGIGGDIGVLYVIKLDTQNNQLIVGSKDELKQQKVLIRDVNWLGEDTPPKEMELKVKLRSRQDPVEANVRFLENKMAEVNIISDFYGAAPGQGCCFYAGTRVMGGGFICK